MSPTSYRTAPPRGVLQTLPPLPRTGQAVQPTSSGIPVSRSETSQRIRIQLSRSQRRRIGSTTGGPNDPNRGPWNCPPQAPGSVAARSYGPAPTVGDMPIHTQWPRCLKVVWQVVIHSLIEIDEPGVDCGEHRRGRQQLRDRRNPEHGLGSDRSTPRQVGGAAGEPDAVRVEPGRRQPPGVAFPQPGSDGCIEDGRDGIHPSNGTRGSH